jgi:hypothetical protein
MAGDFELVPGGLPSTPAPQVVIRGNHGSTAKAYVLGISLFTSVFAVTAVLMVAGTWVSVVLGPPLLTVAVAAPLVAGRFLPWWHRVRVTLGDRDMRVEHAAGFLTRRNVVRYSQVETVTEIPGAVLVQIRGQVEPVRVADGLSAEESHWLAEYLRRWVRGTTEEVIVDTRNRRRVDAFFR